MTEKEKRIFCILKCIEYYSDKLDSLNEDLSVLEESIKECEEHLKTERELLSEVI